MLSLCCCVQASSSCGEPGLLSSCVYGILVAVASLAVSISSREQRLRGLWASVFAALGLQSTGLCVQS